MTLAPLASGKVRELYDAGDDRLLIVASDRVSAFDVVLAEPIPHKGGVLTALSAWWFEQLADVAPNHMLSTGPADFPAEASSIPGITGRGMLVRKAEMLPVECIVRGYLAGSAWAEYRRTGTIHGMPAPAGLRESDRLPEPMFTPSTKGAPGEHDVNLSYDDAVGLLGADTAARARDIAVAVYRRGVERAAAAGIVVADTKLELGFIDGELAICDEVLTPDSSRFWPADAVEPGRTPPSFDKQPLRDWLDATGWDRTPPPPPLPADVVAATSARYVRAYELLTGHPWES